MHIVPLGPGFGAELRGINLADVVLNDAAYAAVRAAFEEHSVLVLPNQDVTDQTQLAFSGRFGPPEVGIHIHAVAVGMSDQPLTKVGSQGEGPFS